MSARKVGNRLVRVDLNGHARCITDRGGIIALPAEFSGTLQALRCDLDLAESCIEVFGGLPVPVAKAIQRNLEPAQAALDLALKSRKAARR